MSNSHHSGSSGSPRQKSPERNAEHIPLHPIGHQAGHSSVHHSDQPAGHHGVHQAGPSHAGRTVADVHPVPSPPPPPLPGQPSTTTGRFRVHRVEHPPHPLATRLHLPPPAATPSSQSMNTKTTNHQLDLLAVNLIKVQEEAIQDWVKVYNSFLGLDRGKVVIDSLHPSDQKAVPIDCVSKMTLWHKPSYQYPEGMKVDFDKEKADALIKRMQEDDPSKTHASPKPHN